MKDSAVLIEKIYCIQAQIEKLYEKTNYDLRSTGTAPDLRMRGKRIRGKQQHRTGNRRR